MERKDFLQELVAKIGEELNGILRANLYELSLKKEELLRLRNKKRELRRALKNCGIGDLQAKIHVKILIKDILTEKLDMTEEKINDIIPFIDENKLTVKDKFDILLYVYKKEYDTNAFLKLLEEHKLLELSGGLADEGRYEINEDDIEDIFNHVSVLLNYEDKLEILSQKIYEAYRGLGVVDELRDMKLDGISGGVSGREGDYHSIWAFVKGKTIHLRFLDFQSESELERICMNIYRYNHPGQLSMNKGYIVNEMKDHSRVVVARPPLL